VVDPDGDVYDACDTHAEATQEAARKNRELAIESMRDEITDLLTEMTDGADELDKLRRIKAILS
jgi:hypothetical protein